MLSCYTWGLIWPNLMIGFFNVPLLTIFTWRLNQHTNLSQTCLSLSWLPLFTPSLWASLDFMVWLQGNSWQSQTKLSEYQARTWFSTWSDPQLQPWSEWFPVRTQRQLRTLQTTGYIHRKFWRFLLVIVRLYTQELKPWSFRQRILGKPDRYKDNKGWDTG